MTTAPTCPVSSTTFPVRAADDVPAPPPGTVFRSAREAVPADLWDKQVGCSSVTTRTTR